MRCTIVLNVIYCTKEELDYYAILKCIYAALFRRIIVCRFLHWVKRRRHCVLIMFQKIFSNLFVISFDAVSFFFTHVFLEGEKKTYSIPQHLCKLLSIWLHFWWKQHIFRWISFHVSFFGRSCKLIFINFRLLFFLLSF